MLNKIYKIRQVGEDAHGSTLTWHNTNIIMTARNFPVSKVTLCLYSMSYSKFTSRPSSIKKYQYLLQHLPGPNRNHIWVRFSNRFQEFLFYEILLLLILSVVVLFCPVYECFQITVINKN